LTLYFIPVIPIGAEEQFVQCSTCKTNSPLVALEHDERSFRESQDLQFRSQSFEAAVMAVMSDETISNREIETLIAMGERILPYGMNREALGALCSSIRQNRISLFNVLSTVSKSWSMDQKCAALQCIFIAVSAEGTIDPEPLKLLAWLRDHFGMTQREYEDAIDGAVELGVDVLPPTNIQAAA